jgi:hypothetical protein
MLNDGFRVRAVPDKDTGQAGAGEKLKTYRFFYMLFQNPCIP